MSDYVITVGAFLAFLALYGPVAYLKFLLDTYRKDLDYERKRLRDLERTVELNLTRIQGTLADIARNSTEPAEDEPTQPTATIQDYVTVYTAVKSLQKLLADVESAMDSPVAQQQKKPSNHE